MASLSNLTRDDARRRSELLSVDEYRLDLDLTTGDQHFESTTTIRFACSDPRQETFVDIAPHALRSARLNDEALDIDDCFDPHTRRLRLRGLGERNELVVDAIMAYSHDGEGLHRYTDPADGRSYVYAMSFLDAAPRWFACFDQPDLKAPVELTVRCPEEWTVAGNGPAVESEPGRWSIAATRPLATYFTTVVAGPYHSVRDEHDGIPLVLHVRRSLAAQLDRDAADLFSHTKQCFDELHRLFDYRYPWGEYHQAFVPEFNAGAMENPGCVTLRDTMIFRSRATEAELGDRRTTVAHEMAHMWFGDLVTMRWWDDLWLNESFAEYLGHRVSGEYTWAHFGIRRKSWGYAADRRPTTHPVAGNGVIDTTAALTEFDGISYAKGASALRQLAVHIGDEVFLDGLRRHIRDHAEANAEFADLIAAWTAAGARDMESWSRAWLRTSGLDTLSVRDGSLQRIRPDGSPARVHSIAVAAYDADGAERARDRVTVEADTTELHLPAAAPLILPDAADETWAKISLDPDAWRHMPVTLAALTDPHARVVIWNALQLAAADAEIDPRLAADIVAAALPAEPDDATIAQVGRWTLRTLAGTCLAGADRAAAVAQLCGAMLAVVDVAEDTSSRQLAAFRVALAATIDSELLRRWLDGHDLPSGVELDAELRWSALIRLAELGALSAADIDAEAEADHSSQGAVHAARARAARPDPEAKAAAWQAMTADADRPNYELYAIAEGFWHPDQAELTDDYVPRYFAEIPATARLRSGWVVGKLASLAYPWPAVRAETAAATEQLLNDRELHGGIRRSVADAGDDLRRALAVRNRVGA